MRKQENSISCYTFQEIQVPLPINKSSLEPSHNSFMNCSVATDVMAEPRSPAETDGPQSWNHLLPDPLPKCLLTPAPLRRACEAFQDMDCPLPATLVNHFLSSVCHRAPTRLLQQQGCEVGTLPLKANSDIPKLLSPAME